MHQLLSKSVPISAISLSLTILPAHAQNIAEANAFGMPGLIEMPSALSFSDADLVT